MNFILDTLIVAGPLYLVINTVLILIWLVQRVFQGSIRDKEQPGDNIPGTHCASIQEDSDADLGTSDHDTECSILSSLDSTEDTDHKSDTSGGFSSSSESLSVDDSCRVSTRERTKTKKRRSRRGSSAPPDTSALRNENADAISCCPRARSGRQKTSKSADDIASQRNQVVPCSIENNIDNSPSEMVDSGTHHTGDDKETPGREAATKFEFIFRKLKRSTSEEHVKNRPSDGNSLSNDNKEDGSLPTGCIKSYSDDCLNKLLTKNVVSQLLSEGVERDAIAFSLQKSLIHSTSVTLNEEEAVVVEKYIWEEVIRTYGGKITDMQMSLSTLDEDSDSPQELPFESQPCITDNEEDILDDGEEHYISDASDKHLLEEEKPKEKYGDKEDQQETCLESSAFHRNCCPNKTSDSWFKPGYAHSFAITDTRNDSCNKIPPRRATTSTPSFEDMENEFIRREKLFAAFERQFKVYAKLGIRHSTGVIMTSANSERWLRHAEVIPEVLSSEEAHSLFKQTAKASMVLTISQYFYYLETIAITKKLELNPIFNKMVSCGGPVLKKSRPKYLSASLKINLPSGIQELSTDDSRQYARGPVEDDTHNS